MPPTAHSRPRRLLAFARCPNPSLHPHCRYQYDPTKIFIYCLSLLGLAYNLQTFPQNEIDKGMLQMRQRELNKLKGGVDWGRSPAELPLMTLAAFKAEVAKGRALVILDGFVLDANTDGFVDKHPGGAHILRAKAGKDVSLDFSQHERPVAEGDDAKNYGRMQDRASADAKAAKGASAADGGAAAPLQTVIGTYKHSNAARCLSETMRIARVEGYVLPPNSTGASIASAATGGFAMAAAPKKAA